MSNDSKQASKKRVSRITRKNRIRKKLSGTAERPRLSIFKSLKHMYAQIIDDNSGVTLASASTGKDHLKLTGMDQAREVGLMIAKRAVEKNIKTVVFDRSGYPYHGVVKELADSARKNGLEF